MGVFDPTNYSSFLNISPSNVTKISLLVLIGAVTILSLSPSASASRCTPVFIMEENDVDVEDFFVGERTTNQTGVTVREGATFRMTCSLNSFYVIKWTIKGQDKRTREVTPQLRDEWNIDIYSEFRNGYQYTELMVNNASRVHNGEYKCTSICLGDDPDGNVGFTVAVNTAINVTITGIPPVNASTNTLYTSRDKEVTLICKAGVSETFIKWYRINDENKEEEMKDVCSREAETTAHGKKFPCKVEQSVEDNGKSTVLKLHLKRVRKDANETRKTISDFRKYVCKVHSDGNQDGSAQVQVAEVKERFRRSSENDNSSSSDETVSVTRHFGKGLSSVTVTQGEQLKIYCDIQGVLEDELNKGNVKIEWLKDDEPWDIDASKSKGVTKLVENDKPLRHGYVFEMAEPNHRGMYTCRVVRQNMKPEAQPKLTYQVRVKDKLGALWPFLGICGEVVVLCIIILVYEQRRNKAELEESDTDGSPDQ